MSKGSPRDHFEIGKMLVRGKDPAGPEFFAMVGDWRGAGHEYYVPLPDLAPEHPAL